MRDRGRFEADLVRFRAASLIELLGIEAFRVLGLGRLPRRAVLIATSRQAGPLDEVERTALSEGFQKLWFSGPAGRAWESPTAAIVATQPPGGFLNMSLAAATPEELSRLERTFAARLGLRVSMTAGG